MWRSVVNFYSSATFPTTSSSLVYRVVTFAPLFFRHSVYSIANVFIEVVYSLLKDVGVFALLELSAAIVACEDIVCCTYQCLMVCLLSALVSAHISFIPQLYSLFVMLVVPDVDDWPSEVLGRSMVPLKSSRCSPGIMSNARTSLIRSSL